MTALKQDAANLKSKLEKMYENVSNALNTKTGEKIRLLQRIYSYSMKN